MKHIRSKVARLAMTVALGIAAGSAQAVPIVFDFTGTVTDSFVYESEGFGSDDALVGQLVSGRITIETEELETYSRADVRGLTLGLGDRSNDAVVRVTSELSIGGVDRNMGGHPYVGGQIEAFDSSGAPACDIGCPPVSDFMRILSSSSEFNSLLPPPVSYGSRWMSLEWSDPSNALALVDLSNGFEPFDLLPLMSSLTPIGRYYDSIYGCNPTCAGFPIRQEGAFFSIDSLTVSVASVPEPGTLALFAVGLLGTGLARRRSRG